MPLMAEAPALSRLVTAGFGAGSLGATLSSSAVPLLFLFYLTEFAHVPPAVAGVLLAIPKFADLVLDPWLGRQTDALARSMGSRSRLIALGTLALPIALVLLFVPVAEFALPVRVALLGVLLVAQSLLQTVFTVAYTALVGDIADGVEGRSTLMSSRAIGQTIGGLAVSMLAPRIVAGFAGRDGGYFGMAIVMGAAALVALGACWLVVRRIPLRAGVERDAAPPLLVALRTTLRNKAFYCIAGILILMGASSAALFSVLPYANQHLLHAGPANLSVLLTPIFLALLLGVAAAPWLARHARPESILGGALLMAAVGVGWLAAGPRATMSMVAGASLFGLSCGALTVLISTLGLQAATQSSSRGESLGLYLGIMFSAEKLGQSLGGIATGFGLDWVGRLDAIANPPSMQRLEALWVGLPTAGLAAALLVLVLFVSRSRGKEWSR
jgi:glycoside/pentoside/hexuronide:cation symporter, GPH family